jgi:flagellum-specific ATP synthase
MLSRDLARQHHYPAVDVLGSISRLRSDIVGKGDREAGARLMRWLKTLEDNRDLVNIGAYVPGADPVLDEALARENDIKAFLRQDVLESTDAETSLAGLRRLTGVE